MTSGVASSRKHAIVAKGSRATSLSLQVGPRRSEFIPTRLGHGRIEIRPTKAAPGQKAPRSSPIRLASLHFPATVQRDARTPTLITGVVAPMYDPKAQKTLGAPP